MTDPSSTSNSSAEYRRTRLGQPLLGAFLVAVLLFLAWECVWRARGLRPSVNDDASLWAMHRNRVDEKASSAFVLAGSSRILTDIVPEVLAEETGGACPVQLGIAGAAPWPVLRHFAEATRFRGCIVVDVAPLHAFSLAEDDVAHRRARECLAEFAEQEDTPFWNVERWLQAQAEARLITWLPELSPHTLAAQYARGGYPRKRLWLMTPGRQRWANPDASEEEWEENRLHWQTYYRESYAELYQRGLLPGPAEREALIAQVNEWVRIIQGRGGRVVFVRLPSSGVLRLLERRWFPKSTHWDMLAQTTEARCVHFEDFPEHPLWNCVDDSHLDGPSSVAFTRAFAGLFAGRGVCAVPRD